MPNLKEYTARLQFWWAKKTIKDGRDFELTIDDVGALITILRGKFKGAQFRFSPLTVREEDQAVLDFQTHVVYYPKGVDLSDPNFGKLATNILRILITELVREPRNFPQGPAPDFSSYNEYHEELTNENRDIDTSQFDQERDFYEESSPVLEKRVSKRKPRKKAVRTDQPVHSEVQHSTKPKRTRIRTPRAKRPK